ncbi:MAG: hypothetical protein ABH826_01245 [Patescibacteria group bacterium]
MVEFKTWGLNPLTVSFLATCFFMILGAWSMVRQKRKIWVGESGKSISITFFIFMVGLYAASLSYGLFCQSLALIMSGLIRGPWALIILVGLWKYKGFSRREWDWLGLISLVVLALICLPYKEALYMLLASSLVLSALGMPYEIYKERGRGMIDTSFMVVFSASSFCWTVYGGWALYVGVPRIWPVFVLSAAAFSVCLIAWFFWFKYPEKEEEKNE